MRWMYWPFIHSSLVWSKMASFFVMRSRLNLAHRVSRSMMVVSPSRLQPSSARKFTMVSGRKPLSRNSSTLAAPWRLDSLWPSEPKIMDRCAKVGTS